MGICFLGVNALFMRFVAFRKCLKIIKGEKTMDINQFLAEQVAKIRMQVNKTSVATANASRAEAIEYLKEKGYELTEANVEIALKSLSSQNDFQKQLDNEVNGLLKIESESPEYIADVYNEEVFKLLDFPYTGVKPSELLNKGENVILSMLVFLKLDARCFEKIDDCFKEIVKSGLVGRIYVTDKRLLINHIPSIFPLIETVCANLTEICSYGISGLDEMFFVLKSGQKITVSIGINIAKEFFNRFAELV